MLDPVERLSEVLFGLIMVLTFTGSISVGSSGHEEVRTVLIGAIGCNFAWGLVDGVMYLMTTLSGRGRSLAIARAVRASTEDQGRALIADELPESLRNVLEPSETEALRKKLLALPELPERARLKQRDWLGALGVFLLVFVSTFPVVLPFVFLSPLQTAMRVSNGVAIVMLFAAGQMFGRHSGLRPLRTGFGLVAIGLLLVALTIAFGG